YYEGVRGWSPSVLASIASWNRFFPITENVRQVDWHGGFTAGAGSALYTARTFPKHYWNRTAFVAEPTGHLVATFTLHQDGTDFRSHDAWNLVASDDEWTSRILAEVGPDGQVWMIDWYNFIVQHNPTPEGYRTGKGAAYETPLRDKTHGRIYRVVAKDGKPSEPPKLSKDDPKGLIAALKSDNMFWRLHAQRLVVERGKTDVKDDLLTIIEQDTSRDALGLSPAVVHALWAANGLGVLDGVEPSLAGVQKAAFTHPSASVRRNAALAFPPNVAARLILKHELLKDPEKLVRLAALLALADADAGETPSGAVASAVFGGAVDKDRWLADAASAAGAKNASSFLHSVAGRRSGRGPSPEALSVVSRVSEHYARGGADVMLGEILRRLPEGDAKVREAIVAGFAKGWPRDKAPELDSDETKAIAALLPALAPDSRGQMLGLASRWGVKGLEGHVAQLAKDLLAVAADSAKGETARIDAAKQLIDLRRADAQAARDLIALVTAKTPPEVASGLIAAVAQSDSPEVGTALVDAMGPMTPASRQAVALALLGKTTWTGSLVGAIEAGKATLSLLTLSQSQALAAHPDNSIADRAKALLARG
ncbi:MAG TPA: glycosyl hydrolase, partial [Isosphaeraceae bacterium]